MSRRTVIVTGADIAPQALEVLANFDVVYAGTKPQRDDLIALCRHHDPVAIIVRYGSVDDAVMQAAPSLKVISKHGSGTDTIDKAAAAQRGIAVRAAAGANAAAVAEQALALMLACAKSVVRLNERMHAGFWDKATHKSLELRGRTVGLVGLGAIGQRFARMCDALEMKVIGFDPFAGSLPSYIRKVELDSIWAESDVISLHCPLTPENRDLVNAQTLQRCRDGVLLVNTARGGLVNEADLVQALASGKVAAAGLDSFAVEPISPAHVFSGLPNAILSPHIGGVTGDAYISMGVGAARNVVDVLQASATQV